MNSRQGLEPTGSISMMAIPPYRTVTKRARAFESTAALRGNTGVTVRTAEALTPSTLAYSSVAFRMSRTRMPM